MGLCSCTVHQHNKAGVQGHARKHGHMWCVDWRAVFIYAYPYLVMEQKQTIFMSLFAVPRAATMSLASAQLSV
jgi:hypothetical protein